MDKKKTAQLIEHSPDRERIETALLGLFGERDIRRIEDPSLEVFVADVLPRLSPGTDWS